MRRMRSNSRASTKAATDLPSLLMTVATVVPVLHLIEHFAQILHEFDRAGFGYHGVLIVMTKTVIVVVSKFTVFMPEGYKKYFVNK
jgi:hypothetical protein